MATLSEASTQITVALMSWIALTAFAAKFHDAGSYAVYSQLND
jgi:hypothetical protein